MKVFVYGTLKEGHGNNRILVEGRAQLVCGDMVRGYKLYNSGFPVACEDDDSWITGEVWDIGDPVLFGFARQTLSRLDMLEGEGRMYHRVQVTTVGGHEVHMYEGHDDFWSFDRMRECPHVLHTYTRNHGPDGEVNLYTWSR